MTRRAMELVMAMALGALGVTVVLGAPSKPRPAARAPVCELFEPRSGPRAGPEPAPEPATATAPAPAPVSPWDAVEVLGYVPVGPMRDATVTPEHPATLALTLTPDPRACHELTDDGRCTAGCFEIMALATGELGPLTVEVAPSDEPSDVIAESLQAGRIARAGFCYRFPLGHAGRTSITVRVAAASGEGPIEVTAWRHRDPAAFGEPPRLDLRLPSLGTPRADVLARVPQCATTWYEADASCRVHGSLGTLPLERVCEDGCTWWTYRFRDDRLHAIVIERSIADVDEAWFGEFADEAGLVAARLERQLGALAAPEELARWSDVEAAAEAEHGPGRLVLQRRTWSRPDAVTTWELAGLPGHHAVAELRVEVVARAPSPGASP